MTNDMAFGGRVKTAPIDMYMAGAALVRTTYQLAFMKGIGSAAVFHQC